MITSRICIFAGLTALSAAMLSSPARAGFAQAYDFTNFEGPNAVSTVVDGINNNGAVVGQATDSTGNTVNFVRNPDGTFTTLTTLPAGDTAFGINSSNQVVGATGNGNAFLLSNNFTNLTLLPPADPGNTTSQMAFGINDKGAIVGQYVNTTTGLTPGFLDVNGKFTFLNPTNSLVTNAQGINNNGLGVGFFAITLTPVINANPPQHGFMFDSAGNITLLPDPVKPNLFLSQFLGINDQNQAAGYWQDNVGSQHGFLYDLATKSFAFFDDPSQALFLLNGVPITVTQITGINNAGDITGFYTDASGNNHGFFAVPVPEPSSVALLSIGVASVVVWARRRRKTTAPSHQ